MLLIFAAVQLGMALRLFLPDAREEQLAREEEMAQIAYRQSQSAASSGPIRSGILSDKERVMLAADSRLQDATIMHGIFRDSRRNWRGFYGLMGITCLSLYFVTRNRAGRVSTPALQV